MLTVHQISKTYGIHTILQDISFSINAGERVGLIGPNGSGKSTLIQLITGQIEPDSGHVTYTPPDLRLGYLAQGFEPPPERSIQQLIHETAGDPELLQHELAQVATALAAAPADEALQQAYDALLHRLNQADAGEISSLLALFGLGNVAPESAIDTLSGGQKTRLALVLLLLGSPQCLVLDEPTNHLDIEMLEWLEEWLLSFAGGVLFVSHDRAFLDQVANRILDLNPDTHTIQEYAGNYTDYLEQFLNAREKQWQVYKEQEYEIRRMRQDIARTREQSLSVERSTTPRQPNVRRLAKKVMKKAKSREKKLDRYLVSEDRVEKPKRSWQMKLALEESPHLGKDVISLQDLTVGYAGHEPLLAGVNRQVQTDRRIVITGPNGAGKTSLLRTIAGYLPPRQGQVRLGSSVKLGYMAQEQELLHPDDTAVTTIQTITPMNETDVRAFLHFFLFTGDEALRPCGDLSFGERARLSLAKLVAQGCNVLLLDEPINHLDIPSRARFETALSGFDGTILAVVHDRYFIERFAQELWVVAGGKLRVRP